MASPFPGYAVIITNHTTQRQGAEEDETNLEYVFVTKFGFHLLNGPHNLHNLRRNLTLNQWKCGGDCENQCIQCLIKASQDAKGREYFLFAVSAHGRTGNKGLEIQFDGGTVLLQDVVDFLNGPDCMKGKQVIMIIEACRSTDETKGQ